jgi:putative nucleotidyltransferase with HDIG domain
MDSFKVLDEIIPLIKKMRGVTQGGYHHLDVWDHSLETLRQFETLYLRKLIHDLDVFSYLNKEVSSKHSRLQLIKLAALLHDIGKPAAKKKLKKKTIFYEHEKIGQKLTKKISESLRLSAKEKDILMKLVFWHLRPGYLADQINPSRRAVYHFFRDTQDEGMGVIILSLSDWRATRGPLTSDKKRRRHEKIMLGLLAEHIAESKKKPLPKLINGYDIMSKFNLESSPLIGDILKKVIEDQQLGKITTKPQAIKLVSKLFKSRRK